MADTALAALTDGSTAQATDIIYAVRDPSGTPLDRKITLANVRAYLIAQANTWVGNQSVTGDISATGSVVATTNLFVGGSSLLSFSSRSRLSSPADGLLRLTNAAQTDFERLQFGGTTSSFPALKRSTTALQARLADDSDFTKLQGQLQTHANAASESITPTHTLTLYDAAGTAYKVAVQAA